MSELFGISLEVNVITLFIGIIIYFTLKWLINKFLNKIKYKQIILLLGTIVLTPILYNILVIVVLISILHYPHRDFDKTKWNEDPHHRYEMAENIIESKLLIGKTKQHIIDLLGAEDTSKTKMTYYLGVPPQFGVDEDVLELIFLDGRVISVTQMRN